MTPLTRQVAWARATGDTDSRPWRSHPEGRPDYLKWGHQALGKRESRAKRKGQNGAQKLRETLVVVGRAKEGGTCELREILSSGELLLDGLGQGCLLSLHVPSPLPVLVTASTSPSGPTPPSYSAHNRGYRCVGPILWFHRWASVPGLANQSIPFPGHVDNTWMGLRVNLVEKRKLAKKLRTRAKAPQIVGMPTRYLQSCVARMKLKDMLGEINQPQKDKYLRWFHSTRGTPRSNLHPGFKAFFTPESIFSPAINKVLLYSLGFFTPIQYLETL